MLTLDLILEHKLSRKLEKNWNKRSKLRFVADESFNSPLSLEMLKKFSQPADFLEQNR